MKFGYLRDAHEKHNLSVPVAEENSSSPKTAEAATWRLAEKVRMETGLAGAVSNRLRLNLG
ncbi:MAG TPA: hypothetical protein VMT42_01420 [candidate division Zixibacteria bacterium]|nr:hypothetical protein [candidate division Zixibacteria bacterium]